MVSKGFPKNGAYRFPATLAMKQYTFNISLTCATPEPIHGLHAGSLALVELQKVSIRWTFRVLQSFPQYRPRQNDLSLLEILNLLLHPRYFLL